MTRCMLSRQFKPASREMGDVAAFSAGDTEVSVMAAIFCVGAGWEDPGKLPLDPGSEPLQQTNAQPITGRKTESLSLKAPAMRINDNAEGCLGQYKFQTEEGKEKAQCSHDIIPITQSVGIG